MKKFLPLICLLFIGCSKKNDTQNNQPPNTVTIGGQLYSTVVIGSQTWTTVNYRGSGGTAYTVAADDTIYGKYYTQAQAEAIALPAGWRLPTISDFDNLFVAIGGTRTGNGEYLFPQGYQYKIISTSHWTGQSGTNAIGFNAEPAGDIDAAGFDGQGTAAYFMSTTITNSIPTVLFITNYTVNAGPLLESSTDAASVRFVKDN